MTVVYLNENFDSVTPPALPSGWSTLNGTVVTSSTKSYSGSNSLKLTASGAYVWAYKSAAVDGNLGGVQASMKFLYDANPTSFLDPVISLRCVSAPSGSGYPASSYNIQVGLWSSDSGIRFSQASSNGTANNATGGVTISQGTLSSTWAANTWYELTMVAQPSLDCFIDRLTVYVQRMSDSKWLHRDGTWVGGVQTAVLVNLRVVNTSNWLSSWQTGTYCTFGSYVTSGVNMYIDDCKFQSAPDPAGYTPTSPPAAGAEVELTGTLTVSDTGQTSHGVAKVNDGTARDCYISLGGYDQWVQWDAGSGVTATPTACLWSPGWSLDSWFASNEGVDGYMLGASVEGANSTSGPWTQLGTWNTNQYAQPQVLNTLRLDPSSPGGTYRYFRLRSPVDACAVSQFYMLVQNSGSVTWKPARPSLSPASGRLAAGATVTMTTQTSGASIYYTTDGTTPALSAGVPQGTTTLYTAPVTIATNAPAETVINALAYHASGTTTTSAVVSGHYVVGKQIVFDTGVTGATKFGTSFSQSQNWPGDFYDDTGVLMQANSGGCLNDPGSGAFWLVGTSWNTPFYSGGDTTSARGVWAYTSSVAADGSIDYFNWRLSGQILPPVPINMVVTAGSYFQQQARPHFLINPNPLDSNKKYVLWLHLGFTSSGTYAIATAPAMAGPWTWQGVVNPGSLTDLGDHNLFYDDVDDGTGHSRNKAYLIFNTGTHNDRIYQLDPATDWTSLTGSATVLTSFSQEGLVMFKQGGYYYVIGSAGTDFGHGNSRNTYISATTIAGLVSATPASIWASSPSSPSAPAVAYSAQPTGIFQVPHLSSTGYVLMFDVQDAFESTVDLYHARICWLPLSTITSGNNTNAFPSAGTLSVAAPTAWDASYLPATAAVQPYPQRSQAWNVSSDYDLTQWEQAPSRVFPATFLPTPLPPQQPQRVDPLPDYTYTTQEQWKSEPIPVQPNQVRFVQGVGATGTNTVSLALSGTAQGNALCVCVSRRVNNSVSSITDTLGRTYFQQFTAGSTVTGLEVWHCLGASAGSATITINLTLTTPGINSLTAFVLELNGSDYYTVGYFQSNFGTTSPASTGIPLGVSAGGSAFVACLNYAGSTVTDKSGWSSRFKDQSANATDAGLDVVVLGDAGYYVPATAADVAASWTLGGSADWCTIIMEFIYGATPTPPPTAQPSQRWNALPDLTFPQWEQLRLRPIPIEFSAPLSRQASQRIDLEADLTFPDWEQFRLRPVPIEVSGPYMVQASQRIEPLPDLTFPDWEQFRTRPVPIEVSGPYMVQASQRIDPLLDWTYTHWEQFRIQPVPETFLATPFPQQGNQRYDLHQDWDQSWWHVLELVQSPVVVVSVVPKGMDGQTLSYAAYVPVTDITYWEEKSPQTILPLTPTIRSSSSVTGATTSTFSVAKPALTQDGDLLVAFQLFNLAGGSAGAAPSGWSTHFIVAMVSGTSLAIWYKVASSEPSSYTFNGVTGGLSTSSSVWLLDVRDAAIAPDPSYGTNTGSGTTASVTGLTTPHSNELVLAVFTLGATIGTTITPQGGLSDLGTLSSTGISLDVAYAPQYNPGAISKSATISPSAFWGAAEIGISLPFSVNPPPQMSQRLEVAPDLTYTTWEQYRIQPIPQTFLVEPFPPQTSQRIDPLPDWTYTHWEQFRVQPKPITFLVTPFPPQASQRWDPLPDWTYTTWEQFRVQPVPLEVTNPPTHQPSQRWDALPDWTYTTWEQSRIRPVPVEVSIAPTYQPSQRWDSLPDWTYTAWEQWKAQPVPVEFLVSPFPPQHSQRIDPLPDYSYLWWEHFYVQTISYIPTPPPTYQASQRLDPLPDWTYTHWEQFRYWPIPLGHTGDSPSPTQESQRWDALPELDSIWWEQFRTAPLPSGIFQTQEGISGIYNTIIIAGQAGISRVANDIERYNVYIGYDALPDLTAGPTNYSPTLPIITAVLLPGSGTRTYYVLVRYQDHYGLESQNSHYTAIVVNSSGTQLGNPIPVPQNLTLFHLTGFGIRVMATYPTYGQDPQPATQWKVWIKTTLPDPNVDLPIGFINVTGKILAANFPGPFTQGTLYYVMVGLFRQSDSALSPTIFGTITIPIGPDEVIAVPSGYDVEP